MPFDKVDPKVDFPALERDMLAFWERTNAFDKLREINRGKNRHPIHSRKSGRTVELPAGGRVTKQGGELIYNDIKVEK